MARRTVTKYRKAMEIPSSRQRRDWKLESGGRPAEAEGRPDEDPATDGDE